MRICSDPCGTTNPENIMSTNEWKVKDVAVQVLKLMHRNGQAYKGTCRCRHFEREGTHPDH